MRSTTTSILVLLVSLQVTRCAAPAASSAPASGPASQPLREDVVLAAPQYPASQPSGPPDMAPRAFAQRYQGKLFTLCSRLEPSRGFCLSDAQVQEIRMRYNEDRIYFENVAVNALEASEKALARLSGTQSVAARAVLGAVLGSIAALLAGVGTGILLGWYLLQPAAPR